MLWKVRKKLLFKAKEWGPKIDILGATCEQRNVPPPQIFPHIQPSGSKPVCMIVYQPTLIGMDAVFIFAFQQKPLGQTLRDLRASIVPGGKLLCFPYEQRNHVVDT